MAASISQSQLIPYDVLLRILETIPHDHGTLYRCSLVNHEFNHAASKVIYAKVILLSPPYRRGNETLDLKNRDSLLTVSFATIKLNVSG